MFIKELNFQLRLFSILLAVVGLFSAVSVNANDRFSKKFRTFSNIMIVWEVLPEKGSLKVTVTMGGALIEVMHFTPDTLQQSLLYSNGP